MPYERPTLSELRQQAAGDINAALPGVDARLRYSNLGILGEVVAGTAHLHYGYIDEIARQSVPFTATGEFLEGWAGLKRVGRKPATSATGLVTFDAVDGSIVPVGTPIARSDGARYTVTDAAEAVDESVTVGVIADVPGAAGNAESGTAMLLVGGLAGVTGSGLADGAIGGGNDVEADSDLRSRMLDRYAAPPQGGAVTDYPSWALEVPGVTRAWLKRDAMGPASLAVLFMMDIAQADNGGFPQGTDGGSSFEDRITAATGDQLVVADYLFPRQSALATVYAVAPIANLLTITIDGLSSASDATKAAIATAIAGALRYSSAPGGITNLSVIEAAIAAVSGSAGFVITSIVCAAGSIVGAGLVGNIQSDDGALPALDGVVFS
jgi:uncharacterized phage protein gp47/JayE